MICRKFTAIASPSIGARINDTLIAEIIYLISIVSTLYDLTTVKTVI